MTPEILLFGIKAIIRLGRQGEKALIDYAVDRPIAFPPLKVLKFSEPKHLLNPFLLNPKYNHLTRSSPFKEIWNPTGGIAQTGAINDKWNQLTRERQNEIYLTAVMAVGDDAEALDLLGKDENANGAGAAAKMSGHVLIEQWKPENKPISPLGRMALAVTEVGLDFAAADPSIFGVGKSGEKVISAFAIAIAKPISDNLDADKLGTHAEFANSVIVAFVRAGLDTLKSHVGDLVSDQHLATLLSNVLHPLVEAAKGEAPVRDQLRRLLDALAGPAASAALKTVAENPAAFLGAKFDGAKAAGALVSTVLKEAATAEQVRFVFTEGGLLKVLSAALKVAADKPGLFIRSGGRKDEVAILKGDLVATLAKQLQGAVDSLALDEDLDGRELAAGLAAAAIGALGRNAEAFLGGVGPDWDAAVRTVTVTVLANLAKTLKDGGVGNVLKAVFSEAKLVELGSVVIEAIAANPKMIGASDVRSRELITAIAAAIAAVQKKRGLALAADDWLELTRAIVAETAARPGITAETDPRVAAVVAAFAEVVAGDENLVLSRETAKAMALALVAEVVGRSPLLTSLKDEIGIVAKAVSHAMALDRNLLLSGADWVEVVRIAVAEASANPARLFGANFNSAGFALAADMLGIVLRALPDLQAGGGTPGAILKGEIIRDAMVIVLQRVSGTPEGAKKYKLLLEAAVKDISSLVAGNPGNYGSKEWLKLIRVVTDNVLDGAFDDQLPLLIANPQATIRLIANTEAADLLLKGAA